MLLSAFCFAFQPCSSSALLSLCWCAAPCCNHCILCLLCTAAHLAVAAGEEREQLSCPHVCHRAFSRKASLCCCFCQCLISAAYRWHLPGERVGLGGGFARKLYAIIRCLWMSIKHFVPTRPSPAHGRWEPDCCASHPMQPPVANWRVNWHVRCTRETLDSE